MVTEEEGDDGTVQYFEHHSPNYLPTCHIQRCYYSQYVKADRYEQ